MDVRSWRATNRHLGLEQLAEFLLEQGTVFVVTIGGGRAVVDVVERTQDFGRDRAHVVAAEI